MTDEPHAGRQRIVILGGGFAGAYTALGLQRRLKQDDAEIVLINTRNYFVFYPLLIEAGAGSLEPRHAVVPIRDFLRHASFRMGEVIDIACDARTVTYQPPRSEPRTLEYDHLVMAMGSVTRLPPVPGLKEHGFEIKSLADAVQLRDRAIETLELADQEWDEQKRRELLRFVVVGANFTGVEVAGEYQAFLSMARRRYPRISADEIRVTLVEMSDRILTVLDPDLGEYAAKNLQHRGVELRLHNSVQAIEPRRVHLNSGEVIESQNVIWCAGVAPPPLLQRLCLPLDERGYVRCDRELRVQGLENVWSIGDCAVNLDANGKPYPPTAQHAVLQARWLSKNIARVIKGQEPKPCDIRSKGSLAALGCQTGVGKVFGVKLSGFFAWWLWRTVYLFKMPGWGRRVRVAVDWTLDLVTQRDYVQLGVHPGRHQASSELAGASQQSEAA